MSNKKIIVIGNCENCPYFHLDEGVQKCWVKMVETSSKGIPNWCMLPDMPERMEEDFDEYAMPHVRKSMSRYIEGWNDCLKALGEQKNG